MLGVVSSVKSPNSPQNSWQGYRVLSTGMGAQLARDVPFSAICWSTLEPTRRKLLSPLIQHKTRERVLLLIDCRGNYTHYIRYIYPLLRKEVIYLGTDSIYIYRHTIVLLINCSNSIPSSLSLHCMHMYVSTYLKRKTMKE